jgi:hypothetical protein
MATDNALTCVTATAGAVLTAAQYFGVALSGANVVVNPTNGLAIYGVLQNDPASGDAATVAIAGITKATAGAAIAVGAAVACDTGGKFITAASADVIVGYARSAAGADLEVFSLDFRTYVGAVA